MAVPRMQCGRCGGTLEVGQSPCPHCGEPVEGLQSPAVSGRVPCPVCGHPNVAGTVVCVSCGVRTAAKRPKGSSRGAKAQGPAPEARKRFEPWQAASVVAILGLVAFVIYLEWTPSRPASPTSTSAPALTPQTHQHAADLEPLEAAVKAAPNDANALIRLANGQHDAGQFAAAIGTYGRYLRLKPDDPDARVDMGICYFELGRMDTTGSPENYLAALRAMQAALDRNPGHQPAVFNIGIVHLAMGNLPESRTWLTKAVAMDKNSELGKRAQSILEQHTF